MFKKLFGSKDSGSAPPTQPNASAANKTINTIQQLTDHEEQLEKRKTLLEKRIEAELQKAKEFSAQKKKNQALQCLKKKKLLESEVNNLDNMIMRVIEQRNMLETQGTTAAVVSTMHEGSKAMKENMKAMKIENVDRVLDEINETSEQMRQIQDVFANPLGAAADLDEDELLGELEELEQTQLDEELLQPAPVPTTKVAGAPEKALPSVPKQKAEKAQAKTQEELELEALQAEMAL